jgi:hypothetical protein
LGRRTDWRGSVCTVGRSMRAICLDLHSGNWARVRCRLATRLKAHSRTRPLMQESRSSTEDEVFSERVYQRILIAKQTSRAFGPPKSKVSTV